MAARNFTITQDGESRSFTIETGVGPTGPAGTTGSTDYNDLDNLPTLGTAAASDVGDFATAAQGALADTALQPDDAWEIPPDDTSNQMLGLEAVAKLRSIWPSNAGTGHFATTLNAGGTFTVVTSTGYARLINSDGTLGAQQGSGVAATGITLTIPVGTGVRAFGFMSVASGGSARSGSVTILSASTKNIIHLSLAGLTSILQVYCEENQITNLSVDGLSGLTYFVFYSNLLDSTAHDALFNSLPAAAEDNAGIWVSNFNPGAPTAASLAKRTAMLAGGWSITT